MESNVRSFRHNNINAIDQRLTLLNTNTNTTRRSKLSIHSKHSDTLTHSVSWHNFLLDTDQKHTAHSHQRESEKMIFHFANHRLLITLTASRHPETERRDRASERANKSSIWILWLALIIGMASPKNDEKKFASVLNFQSITNEQ